MVTMPSRCHAVMAQTLNTGEKGVGTSQTAARRTSCQPRSPRCQQLRLPCGPAQERDKLHTLWSWMPAAAAQVKPPAHGPLQLRLVQVKPAQVLGACGQPEGGILRQEGCLLPETITPQVLLGPFFQNLRVGLLCSQPHSEERGVQSEDWHALRLIGAETCCRHSQAHANNVCFGAVLDLIHLRFQHYKAKRVFAAAGQLVCVVNPTHNLKWEGHLEVVVPHLRQTHRVDILQGAEIVFLATDMHLPAPADWIIMHSCLGHHFLLVLRKQERHEGHPQFFATMMLIGTPTQADCFTYRLELSRNHRRLKWEATPRSVLECVDSVITDGDCLVLNTSLAQLFSDNGSLAIGIAITATEVCSSEAEM
ncbi:Seven in absentia like protein 3 [Myotis davidii]|uniref:E3 ubiquitin-protein ligase n=1 Tax=Myotis davidii TaxID=225400 RepID=L5MBU5_MYODS|nr:Seven in absentia like protein 3 [Myotis davidii]